VHPFRFGVQYGRPESPASFRETARKVEDLGYVVEGCEAPLFVLGGPKRENEHEMVAYAAGVVAAGASGVCFGRNVWGASDPKVMVRRLGRAVHGNGERA